MEVEHTYASKGVANTGLGLGIAGTALGLLNDGALGGIFGGRNGTGACESDHNVNRYEAGQAARIAQLETEVKLRDANTYTDQKLLQMYQYVDGRMRGIEGQIAQQAVVNSQITANISCMQQELATLSGMTKTVIPITNVCPEPMARYNSWTAPTTAAAASGSTTTG